MDFEKIAGDGLAAWRETGAEYIYCGVRTQDQLPFPAFHRWLSPDGSVWLEFFRSEDGYLLRFPEMADFVLSSDASQVRSWATEDVTPETHQHLLLNQVLPLALARRGELVLHAGAVELHGGSVAFLGHSGRGKSTLAAAFAAQGDRFLTDDGLRVRWTQGELQAFPSNSSIRLWADSYQALAPKHSVLAPALAFTPKLRILAGPSVPHCAEVRKLHRIYVLGDGNCQEPKIGKMKPSEAFVELVKHSFLLDIDAQEQLRTHFDEISRCSTLPIFYRLDFPRHYSDLPRVQDLIRHHAAMPEAS